MRQQGRVWGGGGGAVEMRYNIGIADKLRDGDRWRTIAAAYMRDNRDNIYCVSWTTIVMGVYSSWQRTTTTRSILLVVSNWLVEQIVPIKLLPVGGFINDCVGGEERPVCLYSFLFLSGTRKEEVKQNNIEENILLIPIIVSITDVSPEARWLAKSSTEAGYTVFIFFVLASFGGRGTKRSYTPKPRGRRNLSVLAAHSVGYRGGGEKGGIW